MSHSEGFGDVKVTVLESYDNPFKTFWNWYRQTWIGLQDVEYDFNNPEHWQACIDVMERRALPTPMEATEFQIKVEGLSRVGLAQFTRGRIGWAYNVESQMPQHIRHRSTVPLNIIRDAEFGPRAAELVRLSEELYDDMYNNGIPPQDCRYMTMHGQQTSLVCLVNYAALLGYFARRCENGLTDELNLVGRLLKKELIKKHLSPSGEDRVQGSGWSVLLSKLDGMGGDKVCLNVDKVFGNTGRAPSVNDSVPSAISHKSPADYDFSRSAWYLELLELPEDLLFDGEKQMIADFKTFGFQERLRLVGVAGKK